MEDEFLKILGEHPDGLSSSELALGLKLHKRSVLRHLQTLMDVGKIERVGRGSWKVRPSEFEAWYKVWTRSS